ncbi:uracil-DNA glycosylase [Aquisalinus flavus]|uniref:Type-4 uracil-DNA glycosylase n=1 Tax=Aquisalinus flavus TaxID=1526572 RepID=A0A8J2Y5W5_9PROT|nr:uracil-DNA glycosylase [Aquisalinus flavus]MBD0426756.1 uracil-DNA glycosylase [Aquisalinus flavus]UNE46613.1 uracil-DNA glycosylase [Aquisalinus flavus]GGC95755.1 uracil-DNA glycosylase [Aquisalinus flavus]
MSDISPEAPPVDAAALRALLTWYAEMGIDDITGDVPSDFSQWTGSARKALPPVAQSPQQAPRAAPTRSKPAPAPILPGDDPLPADEAIAAARAAAAAATDIESLREAIAAFDGCPLKPGARNTVIDDGIAGAPLMLLGEAPGREEDRIGRPFVGRAGQLLDRMLAAIGHARQEGDLAPAYISNAIFWRPPGNRAPTKAEIAICFPFVARLIELNAPKVIVTLGNTPTQTLFDNAGGITGARGTWRDHATAGGAVIPVLPTFHPAFLLRQPAQKRLAWADLIEIRKRLRS